MIKTRTHAVELLYPELSYSIIGAAMDVHNGLGAGWNEWDYHRVMLEALSARGHQVLSHDRKDLVHRGKGITRFELDLLVDNLVILELKHIKTNFHPEHYTQTINYLKQWDKTLGVLINFGLEKLRYERIPYTPSQGLICHTGCWVDLPPKKCKKLAVAVDAIVCEHGLGYGVDIFKKLLLEELEYNGINVINPSLIPRFEGLSFSERTVDAFLIDSDLMAVVSASSMGASAADLSYLKSYMKQAGSPYGILVNIKSSEIELRGVL